MSFVSFVVARRRRANAPQEPKPLPQAVSADQLKAAIDKLGDFDYAVRTGAARTVRRTVAAQAVPALLQTVAEHADGYVRYRALVILTGFNDPRTKDAMRESRTSPNDRLRTVAYSFFEHHPDRAMIPDLLTALDQEQGEFVRPALVRALAAHGAMTSANPSDAAARRGTRGGFLSAARSSKRSAITRPSTPTTRWSRSRSSTVRCRTMRRWRWERSGTSARSRRSRCCRRPHRGRHNRPSPRRFVFSASTAARTRTI